MDMGWVVKQRCKLVQCHKSGKTLNFAQKQALGLSHSPFVTQKRKTMAKIKRKKTTKEENNGEKISKKKATKEENNSKKSKENQK